MGTARYADLAGQFRRLADEGNAFARRAEGKAQSLLSSGALEARYADSERLAYLIEYVTNADEAQRREGGFAKARVLAGRILAALRAWWYRTPFAQALEKRGLRLALTPRDIVALARAAVRWRARKAAVAARKGGSAFSLSQINGEHDQQIEKLKKSIESVYVSSMADSKRQELSALRQELGQTRRATTSPTSYGEETLADRYWGIYNSGGTPSAELEAEFSSAKQRRDELIEEAGRSEHEFQSRIDERWRIAKDSGKIAYVRFGKPPESGKSRNHAHGYYESGISVYEAIKHPNGVYELRPTSTFALSGGIFVNRPLYEIYGEKIGKGSDGEPVVVVKKSKKISVASLYHPVTGWYKDAK